MYKKNKTKIWYFFINRNSYYYFLPLEVDTRVKKKFINNIGKYYTSINCRLILYHPTFITFIFSRRNNLFQSRFPANGNPMSAKDKQEAVSNGLIKFQQHKYLENKLMLSGVHK